VDGLGRAFEAPASQPPDGRAGPFHVALRAAIEARGLTLERLQDRLAQEGIVVSVTSLSYWQHGRSQPERPASLRAVTVLEKVLGTPSGSLAALLGPRRPRGPRSLRDTFSERPEEVMGIGAPLARLLDDLPGSRRHDLDLISQHETVTIDASGRLAQLSSRALAEARKDGVDRYFALYQGDPGCDVEAVEVHAVRDCAVGRVLRDTSAAVLVAEILFGGELAFGESHPFEFALLDGTAPTTSHSHGFRCRVDQFVLQARFDSGALPARVEGFVQAQLNDEPRPTGELALNAHHAVHVAAAQVGPGGIGIAWQWH
jgi:hypothetical protein